MFVRPNKNNVNRALTSSMPSIEGKSSIRSSISSSSSLSLRSRAFARSTSPAVAGVPSRLGMMLSISIGSVFATAKICEIWVSGCYIITTQKSKGYEPFPLSVLASRSSLLILSAFFLLLSPSLSFLKLSGAIQSIPLTFSISTISTPSSGSEYTSTSS